MKNFVGKNERVAVGLKRIASGLFSDIARLLDAPEFPGEVPVHRVR